MLKPVNGLQLALTRTFIKIYWASGLYSVIQKSKSKREIMNNKRNSLKKFAGIIGVAIAMPGAWVVPIVHSVVLPVHAQTTEVVAATEFVTVYISKGSAQCNSDGLSPEQSAQTLAEADIDVLQTFCGRLTGYGYPAVCGGETGEIIAHQIDTIDLESANELGYEDIEILVNETAMVGYEIGVCS